MGLVLVAFMAAVVCTLRGERFILDSVIYNPGEPRYLTQLDDPRYEAELGFNGKVLDMFDSPLLVVDWDSIDPTILPKRSAERRWADRKAAQIRTRISAAKAAGLRVFAQCDMVVLPKRLVDKYKLHERIRNPSDPFVANFIRINIRLALAQFPEIDGFVVRVGETYTHGSPYHVGGINNPKVPHVAVIPLIQLLREEICIERKRALIFRTWLSIDEPTQYAQVNDAVGPHELLYFGVKHCEQDFHRGNPFTRILGQGRHRQIVEIQCAREYEGKGAYPNYIAKGVLSGFEEHSKMGSRYRSVGEFAKNSTLFAGVWIWSRGGGWGGPVISNEFWPRLNAAILAKWATAGPEASEEEIFLKYAQLELALSDSSARKLRELCILSDSAIIRGKISASVRISPWWSRDDTFNTPRLPLAATEISMVLQEKEEAERMWVRMVALADEIEFKDSQLEQFVPKSARYGLYIYRIKRAIYEMRGAEVANDDVSLARWLKYYETAWRDLRHLCAAGDVASAYQEKGSPYYADGEAIDVFIARVRSRAK